MRLTVAGETPSSAAIALPVQCCRRRSRPSHHRRRVGLRRRAAATQRSSSPAPPSARQRAPDLRTASEPEGRGHGLRALPLLHNATHQFGSATRRQGGHLDGRPDPASFRTSKLRNLSFLGPGRVGNRSKAHSKRIGTSPAIERARGLRLWGRRLPASSGSGGHDAGSSYERWHDGPAGRRQPAGDLRSCLRPPPRAWTFHADVVGGPRPRRRGRARRPGCRTRCARAASSPTTHGLPPINHSTD